MSRGRLREPEEWREQLIASRVCAHTTAPVRVCVTGAAGQIAYSLLPAIASGRMFGNDTPVILHLLDIPPMAKALVGVEMELRDCAFPLLQDLVVTVDPAAAFNQVDAAILVGAFPRRKGMLRKDLLEKNAAIFEQQGRVLNDYAKKSVKVLVVGNPANTNALICMHNAPDLPRENFTALTRLDLNRAKAQIARRVDTHINNVRNIIIWGNHSSTQYPDVSHAIIKNYPTVELTSPVRAAVNDERWVREEFIPTVQQRGAAIIKARQLSSAASAANAVVDHMHDWWLGTKRGSIVSMGVVSDGSYGVPRGLIYSFPVSCRNGQWSIVQNLRIDDFSRSKMDATAAELEQERDTAFSFLKAKQ